MANKSATIHVEYGVSLGDTECSGVLFEIPTTEVIGGDVLDIRIWGMSFEMLAPYALNLGTASMGAGANAVIPLDDIIEYPYFSESSSTIVDWTVNTIVEVIAVGNITFDNAGVPESWATDGDVITTNFSSTNNILTTVGSVTIQGRVKLTYRSTQDVQVLLDFAETHDYQAEWPIYAIGKFTAVNEVVMVNSTTGAVETWAVSGQDVTDRFARKGYSCVTVIDGTDLYGTVQFEFTRSPYYKLWQWTVPTSAGGIYWFFIYKEGSLTNKFAIELPDLTDGMPEPRNITIRVVARDGGASIASAAIYVDDLYVGLSDDDGLLEINGIMTGSHSLLIKKTGFIDTDKDGLYNDTLEVY